MLHLIQHRPRLSLALSAVLAIGIAGAGTTTFLYRDTSSPVTTVDVSAYTFQPDDLSIVAQHSMLVLEGTVARVYPGRWTTPDGQAPQDIQHTLNNPYADVQLRTPVELRVEQVYKGHYTSPNILFTLPGGSEGMTKAVYEEHGTPEHSTRTLQSGTKVVIFLSYAPANAGAWSKISPFYPELYLVVEGETLHGPLKKLSRASFLQQFRMEQQ